VADERYAIDGISPKLEVIDTGRCSEVHPTALLFLHGGDHAAWCWDEHSWIASPALRITRGLGCQGSTDTPTAVGSDRGIARRDSWRHLPIDRSRPPFHRGVQRIDLRPSSTRPPLVGQRAYTAVQSVNYAARQQHTCESAARDAQRGLLITGYSGISSPIASVQRIS